MTITTNVNPYFDDFDEDKNFYRVLFKPGFAVQARELTQLQTALQSQIERFGKNIFREGSIVLGGQFNIEQDVDYIKLGGAGLTVAALNALVGTQVTGGTSGVVGVVYAVADKTTWASANDVLLVRYIKSGNSFDKFQANETLTFTGSATTASVAASAPSGKGSTFTIEEGVVFSQGFFVKFTKQRIVLDPVSTTPTVRIGFDNITSIITSNEDVTLLDNAQGSYNFAAPGADRLVVIPSLKRVSFEDETTLPTFVSLFTIKAGVVQEIKERTQYARIYDEIAKRTFDESGDYVIRGLTTLVREHLDTGVNQGYLTSGNGGDADLLAIGVEAGLAYVKGFEINKLVTDYVTTPKSTDFKRVNSEVISARYGNYVFVDQVTGFPTVDTGQIVNLYDTAGLRVTNQGKRSDAISGTLIGTAKVKSYVLETENGYNPTYRLYLYDIKMNSSKVFSGTKGIGIPSVFFCDPVLEATKAVLKETTVNSALVFPVGANFIKSIRDGLGATDTTFQFRRTFPANSATTAGIFSVSVSPTNEKHSYGSSGVLGTVDKNSIVVTINGDHTITLPGTVTGSIGTNALVGTGTFFTRLNVGDRILVNGEPNPHRVASITDNTNLTLVTNLTANRTTQAITRRVYDGDVFDMNDKGSDAGVVRTVTVTNDTTLAFDMKLTFPTAPSFSVTFDVTRNSALEIKKTRKSSRFVKITCSSLSSLTAPIDLGFSDVFKIRQVRKKTTSAFTSTSEGTDVTSSFRFNNGQHDDFYEHGTLTPLNGIIASGDFLLIELDYFLPDFTQGVGYFSVDSYDIDDTVVSDTTIFTHEIPVYKSEFDGALYDLRNQLDFRPVKQNTAADSITVAGASTNPGSTNLFYSEANGLRIPYPSSQIFADYSYYLARRDVLTLDKDGTYQVVQGTPAVAPVTPSISEKVMGLVNLYIPPYPSLASTYARILNKEADGVTSNRVTNARYTMRDIGVLKQRIDNLEYYNALTLLEKSAVDLKIQDADGLDRFKNGYFVDGFLDHSLGATDSDDYQIAIDKTEQSIRPKFEIDSLKFSPASSGSSNIKQTGNLITLPYTESLFLEQKRVTTTRNIEQSVFRFVGKMFMTPDNDNWVDTTVVDRAVEFGGNNIPIKDVLKTDWNSWQTHITGYKLWDRTFGDRTFDGNERLTGTFKTYAEALAASKKDNDGRFFIESVQQQNRTGIQTNVTTEKQTKELGNFVTDVSVIPYIRPQVIKVYIRGLKANTLFYTFFDGENMSDYCTQGTTIVPTPDANFPISYPQVVAADIIPAEGTPLRSDIFGELAFFLRLPESDKRFRTGTKEVIVTDNPTNSIDATSYAKAYFVANGVSVQKSNTIISTQIPVINQEPITETAKAAQKVDIFGPSCMAYSFKVEAPVEEKGIFLSSVDVYISAVDTSLGAWFEIREMNNAGSITRTQVPFSEVWYKSNELVTTSDASTPHNVKFPSPVFLLNDTQYAFVIHTEGLNPNTYFFISRLGETDIVTNTQVTGRQLTGNIFTTNNNLNWDIVPDIDLKIRFNRATFNNGVTSVAQFNNGANIGTFIGYYEFFALNTPASDYLLMGENIIGSDVVSLGSITGVDSIIVGDKIKVGSKIGSVISIVGSKYYTSWNGAIHFITGEAVVITDASNVVKSVTATITAVEYGTAVLDKFDGQTDYMDLFSSNGKFFVGATIRGETSAVSTTIASFRTYPYSTLNLKPNQLLLPGTSATYEFRGIVQATSTMSDYFTMSADGNFDFPTALVLRSRSDEVYNYAGVSSAQLKVTMSSESTYTSPVLDLRLINAVFVQNLINSDVTGETSASGGNLLNKYISKTVTLAEGQDAEDLLVSLTAYIPQTTDVKIWMKIRNTEDGDTFAIRPWVELTRNKAGTFSSSVDQTNFIEFQYSIPEALLTGALDEVQYTSNGNTYTGFKQFAIKIGLLGSDSGVIPRVADLKVIALQK